LSAGLLAGGQHRADAGGINSNGLLGENVLARTDGSRHVQRPKTGGRAQENDVHSALKDAVVGVEADELTLSGNVDFVGNGLATSKRCQAAVEFVAKHVAHGHQPNIAIRVEGLGSGASSAAAAADQTDSQCVVAPAVDVGRARQCGR